MFPSGDATDQRGSFGEDGGNTARTRVRGFGVAAIIPNAEARERFRCDFLAYFNGSIFPFTVTLNIAPRSEPMARSMISGKHLVNLFACSQNLRSVHPGLRKNTVCPASSQALTSCGLRLIATSAVTMTKSSSLANALSRLHLQH
jgi:hypothetical protein